MNIVEALKKWIDDELAAEGITPAVLDMVDLSIEYSPVIPLRGGRLEHAAKVLPWGFYPSGALPTKFEVLHPLMANKPVDRETLKIMRARYLLARDAYFAPQVEALLNAFYGTDALSPDSKEAK